MNKNKIIIGSLIENIKPTHLVTINFEHFDHEYFDIERQVSNLLLDLQHKIAPKWKRKRIWPVRAFGFIETSCKGDGNKKPNHIHLLMSVDSTRVSLSKIDIAKPETLATVDFQINKRRCPTIRTDLNAIMVQKIEDGTEPRVAGYSTKEFRNQLQNGDTSAFFMFGPRVDMSN